MPLRKHIALTGFMGSGKTSTGKMLSSVLSLPFIDLDNYIEQKEQCSIEKLFAVHEMFFRAIERKYLLEVLYHSPAVIALGGGTVCYFDNLSLIKSHCILICLHPSIDVIVERLFAEKNSRPLISHFSTKEEMSEYIRTTLAKRMPYYQQADYIVNKTNMFEVLMEIEKFIHQMLDEQKA